MTRRTAGFWSWSLGAGQGFRRGSGFSGLRRQPNWRKDKAMQYQTITLDNLSVSTLNVRKKGGKDFADLVPSIRSIGLLQPLVVRANGEGFEVVAGQRRFRALCALAEEGMTDPVPCIIMEDGDDARAIEASLAENFTRLPMDEIDQYKAFAALAETGATPDEIAARFGVSEKLVAQRLAIANLINPILSAYQREEIRGDTLRVLTMATHRQQKAWWRLFKSEDDYAPEGRALREWLFGGSQIPVENALFAEADYKGNIASDLFAEERYFADSALFWELQNKAIAGKRNTYLANGWAEVVILDMGAYWPNYEFSKVAKSKGGKVYVSCTRDGEVTFHEGYLPTKQARRGKQAEGEDEASHPAERSELTKAMQNYLGLHRHAAVRTELLTHPGIALRLAVAHMIGGSYLWQVRAETQRADRTDIAELLAASKAQTAFGAERCAVAGMLGIEPDEDDMSITASRNGMGEWQDTLRRWWTPDACFFDLMRDKQAITAMVREVAGDQAADAHITDPAKKQKAIIAACLNGDSTARVESWMPRYMAFPQGNYKEAA
jgi:ParB family chromosome partitioning protein